MLFVFISSPFREEGPYRRTSSASAVGSNVQTSGDFRGVGGLELEAFSAVSGAFWSLYMFMFPCLPTCWSRNKSRFQESVRRLTDRLTDWMWAGD